MNISQQIILLSIKKILLLSINKSLYALNYIIRYSMMSYTNFLSHLKMTVVWFVSPSEQRLHEDRRGDCLSLVHPAVVAASFSLWLHPESSASGQELTLFYLLGGEKVINDHVLPSCFQGLT